MNASVGEALKGLRFLQRRDSPLEGQVEGQVPFVGFADDPHLLESLDDFEAEGSDLRIQAIGPEFSGSAHQVDAVAVGNRDERIGGAEVRILAHARDEEEFIAGRMHVEVVAVVEISIAGKDVVEGLAGLVGEVLVHGADGHGFPFSKAR